MDEITPPQQPVYATPLPLYVVALRIRDEPSYPDKELENNVVRELDGRLAVDVSQLALDPFE